MIDKWLKTTVNYLLTCKKYSIFFNIINMMFQEFVIWFHILKKKRIHTNVCKNKCISVGPLCIPVLFTQSPWQFGKLLSRYCHSDEYRKSQIPLTCSLITDFWDILLGLSQAKKSFSQWDKLTWQRFVFIARNCDYVVFSTVFFSQQIFVYRQPLCQTSINRSIYIISTEKIGITRFENRWATERNILSCSTTNYSKTFFSNERAARIKFGCRLSLRPNSSSIELRLVANRERNHRSRWKLHVQLQFWLWLQS